MLVGTFCRIGPDPGFARDLLLGDATDAGDWHTHGAGRDSGRVQFSAIAKTLRLTLIGIAVGTVASLSRLIAYFCSGLHLRTQSPFLERFCCWEALRAGYIRARRASRINPMVALRNN